MGIKIIIPIFLILISCSATKKVVYPANTKVIRIDKVKLAIDHNDNTLRTKGNITIAKDSIIKFRFFGPLGIEVLRGNYQQSFNAFSSIEQRSYTNLEQELFSKVGVMVSRKCFEDILIGNISAIQADIQNSNNSGSDFIFFSSSRVFQLSSKNRPGMLKISYKFAQNFPKQLIIEVVNNLDNIVCTIDYLSVKYE